MAEILPLPQVEGTGESVKELLLEQRDVLVRVESVLEKSHVRLEVLQDVLTQSLGVHKEQLSMFVRQLENQEFADEEAKREAAREAARQTQATATATVEPESRAVGGLDSFTSGLAGGLAAGGVANTLRILAGRLITGGGLAAVGMYFGEEIGKFLSTEADAFLSDTGISDQIKNNITTALRENTDEALVFGGISKLIFGRTLPGIIAGFVLGGLDIEKLFSDDPEVRKEFYDNLEKELSLGWDTLVAERPVANVLAGVGVGALALLTKGPLLKRIAVSLIGAYGLTNLLPVSEDIDNFNTQLTNQVVDELKLMGLDPDTAATAVDVGGAAVSGLTASWLAGLINKRLKIPALIAGFIWDFYDLSRIFTPEGRESLLDSAEQTIRRILQGEGMTEDYINATIAGLGLGGTIFAADRAARRLGNQVRPSGAPAPEAVVEDRAQIRNRVQGYSDAELRRAGIVQTAPGTYQRLVDGRPAGSFMAYDQVDDQVRQSRIRNRFPRMSSRMFGALFGAGLSAAEIYLILEDSNTTPQQKAEQLGSVAVGFLGGAAVGALIGFVASWYTGPGAIVVTGLASLAGYAFGDWMATAFFEWMLEARSDAELENMTSQATAGIAGISSQQEYEDFIRQNRERFEAGPNVGIVEGVTVDPSGALQRTIPSFGQQFGFRRPAPQAGTEATAEPAVPEEIEVTPEQRAIVDQITGLMNDLEGLRVEEEVAREQYETRRGRDRRNAALRVENLTTQIENLEEEIESLRLLLETGSRESLSDASAGVGTGQARIYNAALGTTMTVDTGPRPVQAALTPSFSEPRVIRASLDVQEPVSGSQDMTEDQRKALQVYSAFVQAGFSDSQARALVGEVYRENGFREQYWYGTHTDPANEATNAGIISWQGPRKTALYNYLGDRGLLNADGSMKPGYDTLVAQAEYLRYEMETGAGGGTRGQISRYQDWFRSEQVSPDESMRVLGQDFIRWRMNDPQYRESGIANIEYGRSQIDSLMLPSPDSQIAQAPAGGDIQAPAGGDIEAGRSMLGSFSEAIQALSPTGFGFDALFGKGTFANLVIGENRETDRINPEEVIANRLASIFNRGGVATEAVQLNQSSEARTTAPIVINAPQINNDNSVTAGGGGSARTMASQERAIQPLTERSVASTLAEWWDATVA